MKVSLRTRESNNEKVMHIVLGSEDFKRMLMGLETGGTLHALDPEDSEFEHLHMAFEFSEDVLSGTHAMPISKELFQSLAMEKAKQETEH